jgi:hypothetical protein
MRDSNSRWLIPLLLVFGLAGAVWYFWTVPEEPAPVAVPAQTVPAVVEPASPRYPLRPMQQVDPSDLIPLPPLDDSDKYFELALIDLFGAGISQLLVDEVLIEKSVTSVDNLMRGHIAERIRPLGSISGSFLADTRDGGDEYTLSPDNYDRYDFLVDMLVNADADGLVETYRRFYPLLQRAFVNLGYPDGYFNDRVVAVIDHLLETPQPEEPILLVRPHVLYEYADPSLEALSSGQKLLLRMGTKNATRVKLVLAELRAYLVAW